MPSFKGVSTMFTSRTVSERKVDDILVNAFQKLFPYLKPARTEDPARAALMATISNMGTYAFGAYEEPEVEGFKELTTTGNIVRHMQLHWVHHAMEGVFKIQLHDARDLKDLDGLFGGHSDPYVVFSARGSCAKSEVVRNAANPEWNSTHYLPLRKSHLEPDTDASFRVTVFDRDEQQGVAGIFNGLNRDDYLGCAELDIQKLKYKGKHVMNIKLGHKSKPCQRQGSIRFTVEFLSVEKALGELEATEDSEIWLDRLETDEDDTDWKAMTNKTSTGFINTNPVAYIEAESTGTQGWIHVNFDAKVVIVAFRGTEMNRLKDIITDVAFVPTAMTATMQSSSYAVKPTEELSDVDIRLHRGFRDAYDSIRETVLRIVYDLTGWSQDWTICVTGHSLGGALATICAFELANRKLPAPAPTTLTSMMRTLGLAKAAATEVELHPQSPKIGMMNFGAPRVGNDDFARLYNKTVPESMRVVNATDLVHFLPPLLYTHTNHEVLLKANGEVRVHGKNVQSGNYGEEVIDAMEEAEASEDGGRKVQERAFKGLSVRTHMQPYYYKIVQAAVDKFFEKDTRMRGRPVRIQRTREIGQRASTEVATE